MGFKAIHYSKIKPEKIEETGAKDVKVRWLIKKEDDAPNFAMRLFEIQPGGHTPRHSHQWEHEVFILEGECTVSLEHKEKQVNPGYAILIPPNKTHNLKNTGEKTLKFLCLVPHHK